jgi:hypothetical protein
MQPKPAFPFWTSKQTALYIGLPCEGLAQFCVRVVFEKTRLALTLTLDGEKPESDRSYL